jgi:hypothetical protein
MHLLGRALVDGHVAAEPSWWATKYLTRASYLVKKRDGRFYPTTIGAHVYQEAVKADPSCRYVPGSGEKP